MNEKRIVRKHYIEEIYRGDDDSMKFNAPVGSKTIESAPFKAEFVITGKMLFAGSGSHPIEDTYTFVSVDFDNIPHDFMLQYIIKTYGADLESPRPVGAIWDFACKRTV